MTHSPLYELIESRINGDLAEFVKARRPITQTWLTWPEIAAEIARTTGVIVTDETLRRWFAETERQSA